MYCVYGNSCWYIHDGPLFGGDPLLGGYIIGGSTVYALKRHFKAFLMYRLVGVSCVCLPLCPQLFQRYKVQSDLRTTR